VIGRRALAALSMSALLALAPAAASAAEPRASLADIEDEVMCPICGTTLELSGAPQADRERELIRRLIAEGRTKEEIKDVLVAEYGPDVLATPEGKGFDLASWLVPALALGAAVAALGFGALRLRARRVGGDHDRGPRASPEDDRRLEADLARYDV
jgi:cytochrome c-type biogenesis protein CcmH